MKTFPRYHQAFNKIYLPLILTITSITIFFPQFIVSLFYLNWIFLVISVLLLLRPPQITSITESKTQFNFAPIAKEPAACGEVLVNNLLIFLKISFLQFCILILCLGINSVFIYLLPFPPNLANQTAIHIYHKTLHIELLHWGLFPWSLITIATILLLVTQPHSLSPINLMQPVKPIIQGKYFEFLSIGVELFLRQGLTLSISFIFISLALSLYFYLSSFIFHQVYYGIPSLFLILFIILIPLLNSRSAKKLLLKLRHLHFSTSQIFIIHAAFLLLTTLILIPVLLFISEVVQINLQSTLFFPSSALHWFLNWQLLHWIFWLGLTVFLAPIIAEICRRQSLRLVIISNLFWPIVFLFIYLFFPVFIGHGLKLFQSSLWLFSLNVLSLVALGSYFWFSRYMDTLLQSYFYREDSAKMEKIFPVKLLQNMLLMQGFLWFFYLVGGIKFLAILMVPLISTNYVIFTLPALALFKKQIKN